MLFTSTYLWTPIHEHHKRCTLLYSFALRFLLSSNSRNLLKFLHFVTEHRKGERRKTWSKTVPPSLWFKKSMQNPQVWELSRLCPETSTKLYVHEFGFRSQNIWVRLFTKKEGIKNIILRWPLFDSLLQKKDLCQIRFRNYSQYYYLFLIIGTEKNIYH